MIDYSYPILLTTTAPVGGGLNIMQILPFVGMIVLFYFLLIRPQQKKEKDRKRMIDELKAGDRVITVGGIYGTVDNIKDGNIIVVKISGNTKVEFSKSAIQNKI